MNTYAQEAIRRTRIMSKMVACFADHENDKDMYLERTLDTVFDSYMNLDFGTYTLSVSMYEWQTVCAAFSRTEGTIFPGWFESYTNPNIQYNTTPIHDLIARIQNNVHIKQKVTTPDHGLHELYTCLFHVNRIPTAPCLLQYTGFLTSADLATSGTLRDACMWDMRGTVFSLMTPRLVDAVTFHDALCDTGRSVSPIQQTSIILQLVLTAYQLFNAHITHNDIHFRNVLVRRCDPADMVFDMRGTSIRIHNYGMMATLIDFEEATVHTDGRILGIAGMEMYGRSLDISFFYDLHHILFNASHQCMGITASMQTLLEQVFPYHKDAIFEDAFYRSAILDARDPSTVFNTVYEYLITQQ